MIRTPFAGLTALDENDPITIDGGSFGIRNPRTTDGLLRVGAVTHRHDGHAGLPNPHIALTGAVSSGGTIGASSQFALTYTVLDIQGGETAAAPPLLLTTGGQVASPTIAPSAVVVTSAGIMPAGDYYYALTYTDGAGGETPIGPTTLISVPPGFASASVVLSSLSQELAPHGQASQWRLWRSYEGEDWHLVTQSSNDSFDDAGFDPPDNPARPPDANSTSAHFALVVTIPTAAQDPAIASGTLINLYLAPDQSFADPCFYRQLPIGSAGTTLVITQDTIAEGSPPPVSLSKQGANQINPDTDILDWHWKRPVATRAALPSGSQADVRMTIDTGHLWAVLGASAVGSGGWTDLMTIAVDIDLGIGVGASASAGLTDPVSYIEFVGSGGTQTTVVSLGGGSARVIIGAATPVVAASGGASAVSPDWYTEYGGSGGVGVAVQNMGGGSARVLIGFSPEAQTSELNWRGAYSTVTPYQVNDVTIYGGQAQRANRAIPTATVPVVMTGSANTAALAQNITATVPATTLVGDLILVALSQEGSIPPVPAGYTPIASGLAPGFDAVGMIVCSKVATQSDIGATINLVGTAGGFVNDIQIRSYTTDGVDTSAVLGSGVNTLPPAAVTATTASETQATFFAAIVTSASNVAALTTGGTNQFTAPAIFGGAPNFGGVAGEDFAFGSAGSQSGGGIFSISGGSQPSTISISVLLKFKTVPNPFDPTAWTPLANEVVAASGGASAVNPSNYTEYAGSGGVNVSVQNMGGGSARVLIGAPGGISKATQASGYAFGVNDPGTVVESASAGTGSAMTAFYINPHSQTPIPVDSVIEVFQYGTGQVMIVGSGGVQLRSDGNKTKTGGQFGTIGLRQRATDEWVLSGDLAA